MCWNPDLKLKPITRTLSVVFLLTLTVHVPLSTQEYNWVLIVATRINFCIVAARSPKVWPLLINSHSFVCADYSIRSRGKLCKYYVCVCMSVMFNLHVHVVFYILYMQLSIKYSVSVCLQLFFTFKSPVVNSWFLPHFIMLSFLTVHRTPLGLGWRETLWDCES